MIGAGETPASQYITERTAQIEYVSRRAATSSTTSPATNIVNIKIGQEPSPWLMAALDRISHLTSLEDNWNTYGGRAVKANIAMQAVNFLMRVAFRGLAEPAIVPLADGGLQVEWHSGAMDVEVAFSDEDAGILVADAQTDAIVEGSVVDAAGEVRRLFTRLRET